MHHKLQLIFLSHTEGSGSYSKSKTFSSSVSNLGYVNCGKVPPILPVLCLKINCHSAILQQWLKHAFCLSGKDFNKVQAMEKLSKFTISENNRAEVHIPSLKVTVPPGGTCTCLLLPSLVALGLGSSGFFLSHLVFFPKWLFIFHLKLEAFPHPFGSLFFLGASLILFLSLFSHQLYAVDAITSPALHWGERKASEPWIRQTWDEISALRHTTCEALLSSPELFFIFNMRMILTT